VGDPKNRGGKREKNWGGERKAKKMNQERRGVFFKGEPGGAPRSTERS